MATIQDIQDKQNEAASAVSGVPPPLMTIDEEELQQPTIATNIAANKALSQVIIDPRQEFETLYQEALLSDTGTMSAMADLLQEYDSSYNVNKVIHDPAMSFDDKVLYLQRLSQAIPLSQVDTFNRFLINVFNTPNMEYIPTLESIDQLFRVTTLSEQIDLERHIRDNQIAKGKREIEDLAASLGWDSLWEGVGNIAAQDFIPVYNILTRMKLMWELSEVVGIDLDTSEKIIPGFARRRMREHFESILGTPQFDEDIFAITGYLKEAMRDPDLAPWLTKYNVLETFSNLFNDEYLLTGKLRDKFDEWFSIAEVAVEGLWYTSIMARLGLRGAKAGMQSVYQAGDAVYAIQVAKGVRNASAAEQLVISLKNQGLADRFNISVDDITATLLPKPKNIDIEFLPDSHIDLAVHTRSELLDMTGRGTIGRMIYETEKVNAIMADVQFLNKIDGPAIMPKMSKIEVLDHDEGFRIEALYGESGSLPYTKFVDAASEALYYDPALTKLDIVRIGDSGTLETVNLPITKIQTVIQAQEAIKAYPSVGRNITLNKGITNIAMMANRKGSEAVKSGAQIRVVPLTEEYFKKNKVATGTYKSYIKALNAKQQPDLFGDILVDYTKEQLYAHEILVKSKWKVDQVGSKSYFEEYYNSDPYKWWRIKVGNHRSVESRNFRKLDDQEFYNMMAEATDIPKTRAGQYLGEDSWFIRYINERPFHPFDKEYLQPNSISHHPLRRIFTPNAKYDPSFYNGFKISTLDEQRTIALLNQLAEPFRKLSAEDKLAVRELEEFAETWAKSTGEEIKLSTLKNELQVSPQQFEAFASMRFFYRTEQELVARRIYSEYSGLGYKTARPMSVDMPHFHGKVFSSLVEEDMTYLINHVRGALNPVTMKGQKNISKKFITDWYTNGGSIMKIELPIQGIDRGQMFKHILLPPEHYRVGKLARDLLEYHPGYHFRFMNEPFYIGKEHKPMIDGHRLSRKIFTPIKTAGSMKSAEHFVRKANLSIHYSTKNPAKAPRFIIRSAKDITVTENNFFQKQVLQQEGRFMYDRRNFDTLPNVNGNKTLLEDPAIALDRGIHMVARELNSDPAAAAKKAWVETYGRKLFRTHIGDQNYKRILQEKRPSEIIADLQAKYQEAAKLEDTTQFVVKGEKTQIKTITEQQYIKDAEQYMRYFKLIDGTLSDPTFWMRDRLMTWGQYADKWFKHGAQSDWAWRGYYNWAASFDPMKTAKNIAFSLFMKLRPIRQFGLQGLQPLFLAGIDPAYVMSFRWAKDAGALLAGQVSYRRAKYLPIKPKKIATMMGYSPKEARKLFKEFDRAGLVDAIDQHDVTGTLVREAGAATKLPVAGNPLSGLRYAYSKTKTTITETAGSGFRAGESVNVAGTYMVALRRYMKENKVDTLLALNKTDWQNIRIDTSNLAQAMLKANNMSYQHGLFSMATQFLSFQHKTFLSLIGQNPAISAAEARRMWASSVLLYGADFIKIGGFVGAVLHANKLDWAEHEIIPELDVSIKDILIDGMIQNVVNAMGDAASEDWQDLDLEFVAPGPDGVRVYEDLLNAILYQGPETDLFGPGLGVMLGPSGTIASDFMKALVYAQTVTGGQDMPAGERLLEELKLLAEGTMPQFSDVATAHLWNKHGYLYSLAGKPIALEAELNSVWAKRLFGINPEVLSTYYDTQRNYYGSKEEMRQLTKEISGYLHKDLLRHFNGEVDTESIIKHTKIMINLFDDMPEQQRLQFVNDVMVFKNINPESGQVETIAQMLVTMMESGIDIGVIYNFIDKLEKDNKYPIPEMLLIRQQIEDVYGERTNVEKQLLIQMEKDVE